MPLPHLSVTTGNQAGRSRPAILTPLRRASRASGTEDKLHRPIHHVQVQSVKVALCSSAVCKLTHRIRLDMKTMIAINCWKLSLFVSYHCNLIEVGEGPYHLTQHYCGTIIICFVISEHWSKWHRGVRITSRVYVPHQMTKYCYLITRNILLQDEKPHPKYKSTGKTSPWLLD